MNKNVWYLVLLVTIITMVSFLYCPYFKPAPLTEKEISEFKQWYRENARIHYSNGKMEVELPIFKIPQKKPVFEFLEILIYSKTDNFQSHSRSFDFRTYFSFSDWIRTWYEKRLKNKLNSTATGK
ncbi:MAG: hypothetical protein NTZ97_03690 [Candidatus Moranbacteria bacterium]|nr:hypothetical protein [Candidatus Moranbacteria bacterium]